MRNRFLTATSSPFLFLMTFMKYIKKSSEMSKNGMQEIKTGLLNSVRSPLTQPFFLWHLFLKNVQLKGRKKRNARFGNVRVCCLMMKSISVGSCHW